MKSSLIPAVLPRDSIKRFKGSIPTGRTDFAQIFNRELSAADRDLVPNQNVAQAQKTRNTELTFSTRGVPFPQDYRVKKGDTLWGIARNMKEQLKLKEEIPGLVEKIARDNNLNNPSLILAGQNLKLGTDFIPTTSHSTIKKNGHKGSLLAESRRFVAMINAAARGRGVDPVLSQAIARTESGLNDPLSQEAILDSKAINPDGKSFGIFQLIDDTGHRLHQMLGLKAAYNPFHARQNIQIGVGYLKYLDRIFSRESILIEDLNTTVVVEGQERKKFMAAAFNAGEGNVARAQQKALSAGKDPTFFENIKPFLPAITQKYVDKVWRIMARLNDYFRKA